MQEQRSRDMRAPFSTKAKTASRAKLVLISADCRTHGLFPPRDPLLRELAEDPTVHPFEKHLAGEQSPYELLRNGSWTSGEEAAQAGFDMRLFYRVRLCICVYM